MTDQAVLEALAQGSSFEVFRSEYDRVYRAMKRSLLTEKTLLEKCRELSNQVFNYSIKLQKAVRLKQADDVTIAELRKEAATAWKTADAAVQREEAAKELITQLKQEVEELRGKVQDLGDAVLLMRGKYHDLLLQSHGSQAAAPEEVLSQVGVSLDALLAKSGIDPASLRHATRRAAGRAHGVAPASAFGTREGFGITHGSHARGVRDGTMRTRASLASDEDEARILAGAVPARALIEGAQGAWSGEDGGWGAATGDGGAGGAGMGDASMGTVSFQEWKERRALLASHPTPEAARASTATDMWRADLRGGEGSRPHTVAGARPAGSRSVVRLPGGRPIERGTLSPATSAPRLRQQPLVASPMKGSSAAQGPSRTPLQSAHESLYAFGRGGSHVRR